MQNDALKGMLLTLLAAMLWGISGTCAQFIQQERGITSEWLVVVRLLSAGILTMIIAYIKEGKSIFNFCKDKLDIARVGILGIVGIAACQYTYFKAVFLSDAGTATVIQYTAPTMIIVYIFLRYRRLPSLGEVFCVLLAMAGTFMIATHGTGELVHLSAEALMWALIGAVTLGVYTVQPISLLVRYGTLPIVGAAMIFGGIVMWLIFRPTELVGVWDMWTYFGMFGIVILGTVISFSTYLEGVKLIGGVPASILSSVEPVAAAFLAWAFLGTTFTTMELIGFAMILMTIFILAYEKKRRGVR